MKKVRAALFALGLASGLAGAARDAQAQACCVGASGLTPGWLARYEDALVGAQLRLSATHGTYPTGGAFYSEPTPARDTRIESDLFGSYRLFSRMQVSALVPIVTTRRRSNGIVETGTAFGDASLLARYDILEVSETRFPGVALIGSVQAPTGRPTDRGTGRLAADVTGIGAWEASFGGSLEHAIGHVLLHTTVLGGYRFPREVFGLKQHLGLRALYMLAGGYAWDDGAAIIGSLTHASEGDLTIGGADSPGTDFRYTQAALLVITPLTDKLRLRTSVFTDIPPLGQNHAAFGGTAVSIAKTW